MKPFKAIAFSAALGIWSSASAQSFQAQQLLHENPCGWPESQKQFMDAMNQSSDFIAKHGKLVSIRDAETTEVNLDHNYVHCRGKLVFQDGDVEDGGFNVEPSSGGH